MRSPTYRFVFFAAATVACAAAAVTLVAQSAPQGEGARRRPITPHAYTLDDQAYLRWATPPGKEAYAGIDGARAKAWVNEIAAISRRSRDDGEKYWGRISGTKYDEMTETWVENKFKEIGLKDIRRQWFDLPPQWFPTAWSVTVTGGSGAQVLATARPAARTPATPAAGLDLEPVWVGLGTAADFKGRDLTGRLAVIHSVPTPSVIQHSAVWNGALDRAAKAGAAAVLVSIAIPGNFDNMLNSTAAVPTFSIGSDDLSKVRTLIETDPKVRVKLSLTVEQKTGLRDANVWGVLPGATDEDIIVMAHHDAYFEGALDNASGIAVMLSLAEHFAKIPQAKRRRTIKFVTTSGHHNGSLGTLWMHDNASTFLTKTALLLNCEHTSVTQTYYWGPNLRKSNQTDARRWWVYGSDQLAQAALTAYRTFGVAVYHEMEPNASGDMGHVSMDAPSVQMIESPVYYHSDHDRPDIVPISGLEAVARAYAMLIDQVNALDRTQLVGKPAEAPTAGR